MSVLDGLSADAMQLWFRVKQIFPNAIPTSGARSAGSNASIPGSAKHSQHITGDAFDFVVPGIDPKAVQQTLLSQLGVNFGQSIAEYGLGMGPRNHLSVGSKNQVMTANNGNYQTTGYAKSIADDGTGTGRSILKGLLGDSWGNWLSDGGLAAGQGLEAPGKALGITGDWTATLNRVAIFVFALIFIAAALFAFRSGAVSTITDAVKG